MYLGVVPRNHHHQHEHPQIRPDILTRTDVPPSRSHIGQCPPLSPKKPWTTSRDKHVSLMSPSPGHPCPTALTHAAPRGSEWAMRNYAEDKPRYIRGRNAAPDYPRGQSAGQREQRPPTNANGLGHRPAGAFAKPRTIAVRERGRPLLVVAAGGSRLWLGDLRPGGAGPTDPLTFPLFADGGPWSARQVRRHRHAAGESQSAQFDADYGGALSEQDWPQGHASPRRDVDPTRAGRSLTQADHCPPCCPESRSTL